MHSKVSQLVSKCLQILVAVPFLAALLATSAWAGDIVIKAKDTGN